MRGWRLPPVQHGWASRRHLRGVGILQVVLLLVPALQFIIIQILRVVLLLFSTMQFIIMHIVLVSYIAIHNNSDPTSGPISATQCQIAILN